MARAVFVEDTGRMAEAAGLTSLGFVRRPEYVDAMTAVHDPPYRQIAEALPQGGRLSHYVVSLEVYGTKPTRCCCRQKWGQRRNASWHEEETLEHGRDEGAC